MLSRINDMSIGDCKRSYIIYTNFVRINKEVRQMAACVVSLFEIQRQSKIKIDFYDVDPKMFDYLDEIIWNADRQKVQKISQTKMEHIQLMQPSINNEK